VTVAYRIWATRSEHPQLEPAFLQKAWYINEAFDFAIGRPGTRLAAFTATVVDNRVIDGAVNGVAALVRGTGGALRRVQSGYVRNYALAITVGIVALLGFMVTRLWWS
ncbi:MAG: NADH-quinone oxidoreductase subunit L, partial [Acidimicrobiales bacterium]